MKTTRSFEPADRYLYDFGLCSTSNGFAQVDTGQDAPYFGTWADPTRLVIVCYCEGDVTVQQAEAAAEFAEAMRDIKTWNEDHGHGFRGVDCGLGDSISDEFKALGLGDLLH